MKKPVLKNLILLLLAFVTLTFTGCDLLDKADDVTFHTTLDQNIVVADASTVENKVYETTVTLSATTDPEIDKYKDKIKSFKVNSVTYTISNFVASTDVNLSNATFSFSNTDFTSSVIAEVSNIDLGASSSAGTVYTLPVDQTGLNKIAGFLKEDKAVKIYLIGKLSQTPVSFEVDVTLDVTVVANALK